MSESIQELVKLKAPTSKGHGEGAKVDPLSTSIPIARFEDMIHTLYSNAVSSGMGSLAVSCSTNRSFGSKSTIIA